MSELAEEALRAGVFGSGRHTHQGSPLRRWNHGSGYLRGTRDELLQLPSVVGKVEGRVMQYLGNVFDLDHDIPYTLELARTAKAPIHFIMSDTAWERRLALIDAGRQEGLTLYGLRRPAGRWRTRTLGEQCVIHSTEASTMKAISEVAWEERLDRLRDPAFKAKVIAEKTAALEDSFFTAYPFAQMYEMSDYPDYEPDPKDRQHCGQSRADREAATGIRLRCDDPKRWVRVRLHSNRQLPSWRLQRDPNASHHPERRGQPRHGGAHCTRICDAATQTFMLAHWARDRTHAARNCLSKQS